MDKKLQKPGSSGTNKKVVNKNEMFNYNPIRLSNSEEKRVFKNIVLFLLVSFLISIGIIGFCLVSGKGYFLSFDKCRQAGWNEGYCFSDGTTYFLGGALMMVLVAVAFVFAILGVVNARKLSNRRTMMMTLSAVAVVIVFVACVLFIMLRTGLL